MVGYGGSALRVTCSNKMEQRGAQSKYSDAKARMPRPSIPIRAPTCAGWPIAEAALGWPDAQFDEAVFVLDGQHDGLDKLLRTQTGVHAHCSHMSSRVMFAVMRSSDSYC